MRRTKSAITGSSEVAYARSIASTTRVLIQLDAPSAPSAQSPSCCEP